MRQITSGDFDVVYDIYMDPTVNPFMAYDPMDKEAFSQLFEKFLARDYLWLFQHDGLDIGMCSVSVGDGRISHVATIMSLGIKRDFQGLGLGKTVMLQVIDFLKQRGDIKRIELAAEADNTHGLEFYKKLGFSIDGVMPCYIKRKQDAGYVDEILFSKILD